ncbi:MAG: TRAP transporter permease [Candidatus Binatia bacterium]
MQRQLKGPAWTLVSLIAASSSLYHIWTGFFGQPEAYFHRVVHVTFMMAISLMTHSAVKGQAADKMPWYDVLIFLFWLTSMGYIFYHYDWIIEHIGHTETFALYELILAFGAVAVVLECCRRVIGWPLMALAVVVLIYAFVGPWMPWLFYHDGYSASLVADNQYFLTDGLFALPTHISATFIFLFIVFGAFLEKSGFGQFTIDFATAVAGRLRGGPAKVAVLSSGLMGSISGSSTANAVITGSFSIPMMKKIGFKDHVAGAVEAAASTGGLIMPPVMASAGFLMAEYTGIPYAQVMKLIVLPAILYFLSVGIMVHIYAVKEKIPTVPKEELPSLKKIMANQGYLALPLIILIYLLVAGYSPGYAVVRCIVAIILVSWAATLVFFTLAIRRKNSRLSAREKWEVLLAEIRMGPRDIWDALVQGSLQAIIVAVAIITSGIMVGIFDLTGVAVKFSGLIVDIAGGNLLFALVLVMITAIVLGMGLPLSSAYIIQVGIAIPALITMLKQVGLPAATIVPQAHLFVIFFSAFSAITPPTAPTSYAAAAIARSPIMPTAVEAMKLALPAFILPYMFVTKSSLLLIGSPLSVVVTVTFAIAGIVVMGMALQNYAFAPMNPAKRGVFFLCGLALIGPGLSWNFAGTLVAGGLFTYQALRYGRRALGEAA